MFCGDLFYIRLQDEKKFEVRKQAADEVPMLVEGNLTFGGKLGCIIKKKKSDSPRNIPTYLKSSLCGFYDQG